MKGEIMRKDIIMTKIKEINESVELVMRNLPVTYDEFSNTGLIKDGIYKRIEFCIENVFDICAIINTDMDLGVPTDDENIVDNLVKNKILSDSVREKLKGMKGLRNIMVHRYGKVDDKIVYEILNKNIGDFYEFIKEIENVL